MSKPPLGLRPRFIVAKLRIQEILEAMQRYVEADKAIPDEWRTELIELHDWLNDFYAKA
jgi:hypothetical protein